MLFFLWAIDFSVCRKVRYARPMTALARALRTLLTILSRACVQDKMIMSTKSRLVGQPNRIYEKSDAKAGGA